MYHGNSLRTWRTNWRRANALYTLQVMDSNWRRSSEEFWVIWPRVDVAATTWAILRCRGSLAGWCRLQNCELLKRQFDCRHRPKNFCIVQNCLSMFGGRGKRLESRAGQLTYIHHGCDNPIRERTEPLGDFISQKLTTLNKLYVVEDDCLGKDNLLSVNRKCSVISSLIQL